MATNTIFGENGSFKVEKTDKAGKVTSETIHGAKVLEVAATVRLVTGAIKGQQTMSDAWQSLIVRILDVPALDEYRGRGDRTTGKTAATFKDAIRKAEDQYFDQLAADKVAGIPSSSEKRNEMVKAMRNDNNYSNIRSTCAKYFAFVGALPATDSGYLVPRPIMLEQIKAVLNIQPEDTSLKGRIVAMLPEIEGNTDAKVLREAYIAASDMIAKLKLRMDHLAEVATNAAAKVPPNENENKVTDMPAAADKVIRTAADGKKNKGQISPKSTAGAAA